MYNDEKWDSHITNAKDWYRQKIKKEGDDAESSGDVKWFEEEWTNSRSWRRTSTLHAMFKPGWEGNTTEGSTQASGVIPAIYYSVLAVEKLKFDHCSNTRNGPYSMTGRGYEERSI